MGNSKTNHIGDTIRIRRPPRVVTDELGRNTWMGDIESYDLELERAVNTNPYDSSDLR